jgi:HD-GYP domain-containing protein (c-di-GMP phosphodiesterase class II)
MRSKNIKNRFLELRPDCLELFKALALVIESRDPDSKGHSEKVALLAREIAQELDCPDGLTFDIEMAARIHDIGKVGIRDDILLKSGVLTVAEWLEMMQHPSKGAEMIRPISFLQGLVPIVEGHHEHFDGTGYPHGLKGEEIHLGARILAVADAYDALTSGRPYRSRFSHDQAIKILQEGGGAQWDPKVVDAFLGVVQRKAGALWL